MHPAVYQEFIKSIFAKAVAVGFIVQILLGNYWLVVYFFGGQNPTWLMNAFLATAFWIMGFGILLLFKYFFLAMKLRS